MNLVQHALRLILSLLIDLGTVDNGLKNYAGLRRISVDQSFEADPLAILITPLRVFSIEVVEKRG